MFQQLAGEVGMAAPSSERCSGEWRGQDQTPQRWEFQPTLCSLSPVLQTSPSWLWLSPAACRDGVTGADLGKSI